MTLCPTDTSSTFFPNDTVRKSNPATRTLWQNILSPVDFDHAFDVKLLSILEPYDG